MDTDVPKMTSQVSVPPVLCEEPQYESAPARVIEAATRMKPVVSTRQTTTAHNRADRQKKTHSEISFGPRHQNLKPADFHSTQRAVLDLTNSSVNDLGNTGSGPPPSVPARTRPKLGQSSLATPNVLPAARAASNNNFPRPSPRLTSSTRDENANVKQHERREEGTFRSLPSNLDDQEARAVVFGGVLVDPPPIVPRRKAPLESVAEQDSYDKLRKPGTINEWLLDLGLPEYIRNFYESGWDQLEYMDSITDTDLIAMQIHPTEHRQRIMKSVRDMRSQ